MVVNIVATNQPLCVAALRKLAMSLPQYTPPPAPEPPIKTAAAKAKKTTKTTKTKKTAKTSSSSSSSEKGSSSSSEKGSSSSSEKGSSSSSKPRSRQAEAAPSSTARSHAGPQGSHQGNSLLPNGGDASSETNSVHQQHEQQQEGALADMDPSKMVLLDPCMYNTSKV